MIAMPLERSMTVQRTAIKLFPCFEDPGNCAPQAALMVNDDRIRDRNSLMQIVYKVV